MQRFPREAQNFRAVIQHPHPCAMAGFPDSEQRHLPQHSPGAHFGDGSGGMAVLVNFNRKAAPLHWKKRVSHLVLFNQNSTLVWAAKLGLQQLLMGLEQIPQPAVDRFRCLCCGIYAGQATTPILIGTGLIP